MTAQAVKGMRERCLSVGMDDYLVKPVRRAKFTTRSRPCSPVGSRPRPSPQRVPSRPPRMPRRAAAPPLPESPAIGTAAIDWDSAIAVVDGDRELLGEVVAAFLIEGPTLSEEIRQALAAGDANRLRRGAHTLKGALRTLGIELAAQSAGELEEIGRSGDLSRAPAHVARLESQLDQILSEAKSFASAPQTR